MSYWLRGPRLRRSQQLLREHGRSSVASTSCAVGSTVQALSSEPTPLAMTKGTVQLSRASCLQTSGQHYWKHFSTSCARHLGTPSIAGDRPQVAASVEVHSPGHEVATIAVSNPAKLNIVNSSLLQEFVQRCHELSKNDNLRAVVLTNAPTNPGKAASWIGGADIKEMAQLSSADEARAFIDRIHQTCDALRAIPVPVIASIDGFCLGAGMEIAASCDLRIATRGSTFGMPEVKVGIPSVVEAAYLPGLIGMGRTRRLLYLAENLDVVTAERWGFVERFVEGEEELRRATEEWVDALIRMGPKAIRSQKRLMQRWEDCKVMEGIEAGARAYAEAFADGGGEPKAFMRRFLGRTR